MYKALKSFDHDELGRIKKGSEFKATQAQIGGVKSFVEEVENKIHNDKSMRNKRSGGSSGKAKK